MATRDVNLDIPRWLQTTHERPPWDERNRMIAAYVPRGSDVIDLGGGAQTLAVHLPSGCSYQPCDVVPGPDVLLCDLGAGRWPAVDRRYDLAVCSGLLEYVPDVKAVLAGLESLADRAIVTYRDRRRNQSIEARKRAGWHSHLRLSDLRATLDGLEGEWRFLTEWNGHVLCAIEFRDGLPPLRDGDALIEEGSWERSFAQLLAFARRTGHAQVPLSLVENGVGLGAWVRAQRGLHRRGTLTARRTTRLQSVPGWTWRAVSTARSQERQPAAPPSPLAELRAQPCHVDAFLWTCYAVQGPTALDIGCGQGSMAIALARAGLDVVGFDDDAEAVGHARGRVVEETTETQRHVTFVSGDGGPLPLGDGTFDTVLLIDASRRSDRPESLFHEARRLVKPRGRVVLTAAFETGRPVLADLHRLVRSQLRPVEVVHGADWLGVVAVLADPSDLSEEPWMTLLDVAEDRLTAATRERERRQDEDRARIRDLVAERSAQAARWATDRAQTAATLERERARSAQLSAQVHEVAAQVAGARRAAETARAEADALTVRTTADTTARENRLREVREASRALAQEVQAQAERVAVLEAELTAWSDQAAGASEMKESLAELDLRTRDLEAVLAERDRELASLRSATPAKSPDVRKLKKRLRAARSDAAEQHERAARLEQRLEQRGAQLAAVRAGRAYRLAAWWGRVKRRLRHPRG